MAKILLVDDSEVFRILICKMLDQHEVIESTDGLDGLCKLKTIPDIQLILCDMNMPNMGGLMFCQKKSELPEYKMTPIIMLTTESNIDIKKEAKKYGVKAWMLKPIDKNNLLEGIKIILESV